MKFVKPISTKELVTSFRQKQRERKWGDWEFMPANLTLLWCGWYEIDLEQVNSTAKMLDWIFQCRDRDVSDLTNAFQAIFIPQKNCCSWGIERRFSGRQLAKSYASLLTPSKIKVPPRLRFDVLTADGYCCRACGAKAADGAELHVDHIVPRAHGGTNERSNLQTLCRVCNLGKGARLL